MNAIVTARVPVEIKEQGNEILKEIGSSPTKLINAAYSYLLATHEIPSPRSAIEYQGRPQDAGRPPKKKLRIITKAMREEVERSLEACSFDMPQSFWDEFGDRDYKDIIAEGKRAEYEALG